MRIVYKSFLYEAWDLKAVKEKFGKQLEEYLKKYNDSTPVEEYFNKIYEIDPSADKKYLGAITKWVLEKRPEDLETQIQEYLGRFKKLLDANPGRFGAVSKAIVKGQYSLDKFKEIVNSNDIGTTDPSTINAKNRIKEKTGDFRIVGENQNYVCYKVDEWISNEDEGSKSKHFCFTGNVDWCVKYRKAFEEYYPPYYYFLDKSNGNEFALMHIDSYQLKDVRDNPLTKEDYLKIKDIVVKILGYTPFTQTESFGDTDFKVIFETASREDLDKIFSHKSYVATALGFAFAHYDDIMINKLFEVYSSEELLNSGNSADILSEVENFIDDYSYIQDLTTNTVKKLIDSFEIDPYALYEDLLKGIYGANEETYEKIWRIETLLAKEYIDPNEILDIKTRNSNASGMTAFEYAIFKKAIGAVEVFLKNPDIDVNTTNLGGDEDLLVNGVTPIYYIANLGSYEHDVMFSLLVKDPRVNVNTYIVRKTNDDIIYCRSVLDLIGESYSDRRHDIIARGGKTYKDLVQSGEIPEYTANQETN